MKSAKPIYLILIGAPGAGKGTQAQILENKLGIKHVSTGDIFRENISAQTSLGQIAKMHIDRGELVPDDVTVQMVEERLSRPDCEKGAILDGFPRTLAQASDLDALLAAKSQRIAIAILLHVRDDEVVLRLSGRRVCRTCRAVFNLQSSLPPPEGNCPQGNKQLCSIYQRDDDEPETIRNRLFVYYKQTSPLIGYYYAHGVLSVVDGSQSTEKVASDTWEAIGGVVI